MVERLGEMRKGRKERIKKGSREGIEIQWGTVLYRASSLT